MLQADVRHVAIAHRVGLIAGDSHYHLPYIVGGKRTLFEEAHECVERSLDGRAYRPLLDVRAGYLVALPELFDELRRIGLDNTIFPGRQGFKKIVGARENVANTGPTLADQHRGRDY